MAEGRGGTQPGAAGRPGPGGRGQHRLAGPRRRTAPGLRNNVSHAPPSAAPGPRAGGGPEAFGPPAKPPRRPGQQMPAAAAEVGLPALHHDWIRTACGAEPDNLVLEIATGDAMGPTIRNGD